MTEDTETGGGPLLPLLPPYLPGRYDYYCPGPCAGTCKHSRLTVAQAHDHCRERYALTGEQRYLDRALAYVEYL